MCSTCLRAVCSEMTSRSPICLFEQLADLLVRAALRDEGEDVELARREPVRRGGSRAPGAHAGCREALLRAQPRDRLRERHGAERRRRALRAIQRRRDGVVIGARSRVCLREAPLPVRGGVLHLQRRPCVDRSLPARGIAAPGEPLELRAALELRRGGDGGGLDARVAGDERIELREAFARRLQELLRAIGRSRRGVGRRAPGEQVELGRVERILVLAQLP
jgi:hypothetical protein